jgi:hypothetical protein
MTRFQKLRSTFVIRYKRMEEAEKVPAGSLVDLASNLAINSTEIQMRGAFWDTAPCSSAEVDGRFRGAYCLHHEGDE